VTLVQVVGDVADAIGQLKALQEVQYEDEAKALQPLDVPAEIVALAEYRKRRVSDRSGETAAAASLGGSS
jgi:hypothetical protein